MLTPGLRPNAYPWPQAECYGKNPILILYFARPPLLYLVVAISLAES